MHDDDAWCMMQDAKRTPYTNCTSYSIYPTRAYKLNLSPPDLSYCHMHCIMHNVWLYVSSLYTNLNIVMMKWSFQSYYLHEYSYLLPQLQTIIIRIQNRPHWVGRSWVMLYHLCSKAWNIFNKVYFIELSVRVTGIEIEIVGNNIIIIWNSLLSSVCHDCNWTLRVISYECILYKYL